MAVIVKVSSAEGDVFFETDPSPADLAEIGLFDRATDIIKEAATSYDTLASLLRRCTTETVSAIDSIENGSTASRRLTSAQVELGIKLTAAGNVVVAKGTAEANVKVVLTWELAS